MTNHSRVAVKGILVMLGSLAALDSFAQTDGVLINFTGATRDNSAVLEASSTQQGLLVPRMNQVQRNAIASPANSLLIYQTDNTPGYYYYDLPNTTWQRLFSGSGAPVTGSGVATRVAFWDGTNSLSSNANLYWDNGNSRLGIGTAAPADKLEVVGGAVTLSNAYLDINRDGFASSGISWYSKTYPGWSTYMAQAGQTGVGPHGDLTAPAGTYVTSWAMRSYIENIGGYGWTFESAANPSTTPAVRFEILSNDGTFHGYGDGRVDGVLYAGAHARMGTNVAAGYYQDATNGAYRSLVSAATTNGYYFQTNAGATTTMYVGLGGTYNGRVGIGTTTPNAALQLAGNNFATFGPNSTWGATLRVGGNGNVDNNASVAATNGNLHLDAASGAFATYLNYYRGTSGVLFGNGASGTIGSVDNSGYMSMNNAINSQVGYRVAGGAGSGQYLRGNGTNFVSSGIQAGDLPTGSSNYIQNQIGAAQTANWWVSGNGVANGTLNALSLGVSNTASNTGRGLSLYNGPTAGAPTYGIMFAGIGTFGGYGTVNADWATYFTMSNNLNRGWIFRRGATNVASVSGGGNLALAGVVTTIQGFTPANNAMRMTPNFHLNAPAGNAIIVNWDNGAVGGTTQQFRVGNGSGTDQFYVRADGGAFGRIWYDLDNSGYYLNANGTSYLNTIISDANIYNAGWYRGGTADNGHFRVYGNSRTVVFRTDGQTAYGNNGAYPFIWNYGGDDASQRRMILANNGDLWTASYGWLHDGFIRNNGSGDWQIASNSNATGYSNATLELRETNFAGGAQQPPRLGFHWGGVVASQIAIESDGTIAIRNNPGTAYEKLRCLTLRSNGFIEPSDERLKKNIMPITNALDKVMALHGVTYNWNKEIPANEGLGDGIQYGLIAQELEKIIPELVNTDEEGWKSVEYTHLAPVLIEALKEQQDVIDALRKAAENDRADIDFLKNHAKSLEAKLNQIIDGDLFTTGSSKK